jgi:Flp pilus assembly protein TadD
VAGAIAYLALLAPALGLAPSGLQATADRYTYLPDVAIALLLGAGFGAAMFQARRPVALAGLILAGMLGTASARQTGYWRDSVTLWTRAAELDPRNDVAFYNLALALEEAGDAAGAEARLRETLRLVPDHEPARRHLASLEARRLEWEAGGMAASGRLEEAIAVFTRALEKDPARMRAHASRGMALAQLGRFAEAAESLEAAVRLGNDEPEVAGALAFVLGETGRLAEARGTLDRALARYPGDARLSALASRLEAKAHVQQKKSPRP